MQWSYVFLALSHRFYVWISKGNNHIQWIAQYQQNLPNIIIYQNYPCKLIHCGRVTHICVSKLTIIGSDNGESPGRRQAIILTNAGISSIRPLGTNFSEILITIQTFSFKKMHSKMLSAKWHPFCLGLNVLTQKYVIQNLIQSLSLYWKWEN